MQYSATSGYPHGQLICDQSDTSPASTITSQFGTDFCEAERSSTHTEQSGPICEAKSGLRTRPLTQAQLAFVEGVFKGETHKAAYRAAYPGDSSTDASISTSASRLLRDQRIQKALRDAQEADPELLMDDPTALKRYVLTQLLRCASQFKQEGSKIKALELMGKSVGLFVDKGEHTAIPVSADQLKKELAGHLRLLDNRNAGEPSTLDAICSVHANRGRH